MFRVSSILADSTEEMIKLIFGAVFVLIWIVGGLMSAAKKKPRPKQQERSWEEIFNDLSAGNKPSRPAPPPPPPHRPAPPPPPPREVVVAHPPGSATSPPPGRPPGPGQRKKLRSRKRIGTSADAPPVPPPVEPASVVVVPSVLEVSVSPSIAPISEIPSDIARTEIGSHRGKAGFAGSDSASQIRKLLRPAALRHQFILTELLQPPKALRDEP